MKIDALGVDRVHIAGSITFTRSRPGAQTGAGTINCYVGNAGDGKRIHFPGKSSREFSD